MFGKPNKSKKKLTEKALAAQATITEKDRAILNLKTSRDKLKRYQKGLDEESVDLRQKALSLINQGKKSRAILLLKIRKLKEDRAKEIDQQLYRLYEEIEKVENADLNVTILKAIETGTKVLQQIQREYTIERVEQLMEDSAEAIEKEREISAMISNIPTGTSSISEADLEAELRELVAMDDKSTTSKRKDINSHASGYMDGNDLPHVPVTPVLPAAPQGTVDMSANQTQQRQQQPLST